jgi:hypothetical protein
LTLARNARPEVVHYFDQDSELLEGVQCLPGSGRVDAFEQLKADEPGRHRSRQTSEYGWYDSTAALECVRQAAESSSCTLPKW